MGSQLNKSSNQKFDPAERSWIVINAIQKIGITTEHSQSQIQSDNVRLVNIWKFKILSLIYLYIDIWVVIGFDQL